jgi:hypothetical protein
MATHVSKVLKLPVAKLGSWFHETYGTIEFSQADLDDFARNFHMNARGYEPYARYGHSEKGPGLHGGEPALAHMIDVFQEGDVLYGLFTPKTEKVVSEVENDEYRYISPEFVRCAYDRDTNARLGPLLLGVALTNSPSIPWLPRNTVIDAAMVATLTDGSEAFAVLYELVGEASVPDPNPIVEPVVAAEPVAEAPAAEQPAVEAAAEHESALDKFLSGLTGSLDAFSTKLEGFFAKAEAPIEEPKAEEQPEAPAAEPVVEEPKAEEQPQPEAPKAEEQAPAQSNDEVEALKLKLAAAETALGIAEAAKAAAETERKASEEKARQIEAARKREAYVAMLTDRADELIQKGLPPVAANKAKDLALALSNTETVMLGDAPINTVDAIFGLYSDLVGVVDLNTQKGATPPAQPKGSAWEKRIAALKAQA